MLTRNLVNFRSPFFCLKPLRSNIPRNVSQPGGSCERAFSIKYTQCLSLSSNCSSCSLSTNHREAQECHKSSINYDYRRHYSFRPQLNASLGKKIHTISWGCLALHIFQKWNRSWEYQNEIKYSKLQFLKAYIWKMFSWCDNDHWLSTFGKRIVKVSFAWGCNPANGCLCNLVHAKLPSPLLSNSRVFTCRQIQGGDHLRPSLKFIDESWRVWNKTVICLRPWYRLGRDINN